MAIRYEQSKIDEVVAFVVKHNNENGRGGQSAAVKKYGINPITVASWLKKSGVKTPGKKRGSALGRKGVVGGSDSAVLKRMLAIQEEIESLQGEYDALRNKI